MKLIEEKFNSRFARWEIALPAGDIAQRKRGKIQKGGWVIRYLFGADEKGEYLDCYAQHRNCEDHYRLYANGERQNLPTPWDVYQITGDPIADAKAKEAFLAHNQEVASLLAEKGFGIEGNEPLGIQLNSLLRTTDTGG